MRKMYDSTSVADLPAGGDLYAGYADGNYRTVAALKRRFRRKPIVTITVLGTSGADVCDTEPGNIGIDAAARWAAGEVKAGRKPTLYCMASQWGQVKRAVASHGITGRVSYWIADYDGDPTLPKGAVAKQYLHGDLKTIGASAYSGGHYDVSVVADHWPGVDPPTPPLGSKKRGRVKAVTDALTRRKREVHGSDRTLLTRLLTQVRRLLGRS